MDGTVRKGLVCWAAAAAALLSIAWTSARANDDAEERSLSAAVEQAERHVQPGRRPIIDTHIHFWKVTRPGGVPWPTPAEGPIFRDVLLLSWGGTFGSVRASAEALQGKSVAHAHLRWLSPMPRNTGEVLRSYKKVLVPEVNNGQLAFYIRAMFPGIDPLQHNRINGKALNISEIVAKVNEILG